MNSFKSEYNDIFIKLYIFLLASVIIIEFQGTAVLRKKEKEKKNVVFSYRTQGLFSELDNFMCLLWT